ncbi:hypothetical protein VE03_09005 [Pseudogymnoascus sp. 23342-1-I1]|nr:hypothetical protein VE03_09005 [Pseudogymnoascus sp. 23342-1-I1]
MSFGYSVGDIIAVADLANKIRQRFVDSPGQFKAIATEVRSLSIVLQDADIVLPERELTSQQETELEGIVQGCRDLLEELKITLDRYQELDSGAKGSSERSRKVWKKLTWDQKDIDAFRSRISSNIMLLNTFLGLITSQAISAVKDGVDQLNRGQEEHEQKEERQTIIDWLSPVDYASQHSDFMARHQEGTGLWLLDSNEFKHWLKQGKQRLFCPGMPGAGKTMIASIVIDHLYAKYQPDPSVGIAYLYCNFRRQDEQKPVDLLASLLKRLAQGRPTLPTSIKDLYESHVRKQTRPSFEEISKQLQSIIASFSTTFIVIDALDECQVSDGGQTKFLSEILRLQTNTKANLFATSRFIPHIVEEFQGCPSLEIRASEGDVQRYLDGQLARLPSFVRRNLDMQEQIKAEIIKAVDGMFLLAQLHLESLIGKRSPKAIKEALKKLPTGSEAYDYAYKEAMERIEGQLADCEELAKQALGWITCSKRPLTTLELQHALAVEIGQPSLDEENLPEIEDVVSVCAGLVTIDEGSGIIRLVHYTTQEYFERTWISWFCSAQEDMAKTCVTYLAFSTFEKGLCATTGEFEARLQLNPLYNYSARNWAYYACVGSTEVEELTLHFLQNDAAASASSQAMTTSRTSDGYDNNVPGGMIGIHLAAYFGLKNVMAALLKKGHHPDSKAAHGATPLSLAAAYGHEEVVKLLLTTSGVDIDIKDTDGYTPLSMAATNGHGGMVKLLLATASIDINSRNMYGETPLLMAAMNGHKGVVKLLLATAGVDINSRSIYGGETPLLMAALRGHEEVVKLLLATASVDVDSKSNNGRTPLSMAASGGHEEVVKLLVATAGVDVNSKDDEDETPLSVAASNGNKNVVRLLLAIADVDPDPKDIDGETPLWVAAQYGHRDVVELLLARADVGVDSKNPNGETPLWTAAHNGNDEVVKLLLATGDVGVDSKNLDGETPLWTAAQFGCKEVVKLLLATGDVDVNSKNLKGNTPLSMAAKYRQKEVVELLVATPGVEVDSKNFNGETPLWIAARGETRSLATERGELEEVVKILLSTPGVDVDSKNADEESPRSIAARYWHMEVVELLILSGAKDTEWRAIIPCSRDTAGINDKGS